MELLTNENYYSHTEYMSASQFKAFEKCEAAALAEVRGEWERPKTTALLFGGLLDAFYSGEDEEFKQKNPELFKRDGNLKAEYVKAYEVGERIMDDNLFFQLIDGEKQRIVTGEIGGVPFKGKMDFLLSAEQCRSIVQKYPDTAEAFGLCDGAIVDLKVMRDTEEMWNDESRCRVPFAMAWRYDIQGAIYQHLQGRMLPFILAVATKETPPDLKVIYIPQQALTAALAEVDDRAPRYQAIKEGKIQPVRCEGCAYCRATRKLSKIVRWDDDRF